MKKCKKNRCDKKKYLLKVNKKKTFISVKTYY